MKAVLDKFEPGHELEIRFALEREQILRVCAHIAQRAESCASTTSVHAFYKGVRYEREREHGTVQYIKKQRIARYDDVWWKLHLSAENAGTRFALDAAQRIRLRARTSYILNNWSWDFTYTAMPSTENLRTESKAFFDDPQSGVLEFECEYLGQQPAQNNVLAQIEIVRNALGIENTQLARTLEKLARRLHIPVHKATSLKRIASQPHTLYYDNVGDIRNAPHDYYVSVKADGERAWIWMSENLVITDTLRLLEMPDRDVICDCEIIGERILIFDCIYCNGDVREFDYMERLQCLDFELPDFMEIKPNEILLNTDLPKFYAQKRDYEIDGLIFTHAGAYNNAVYKWKPLEKLSIDLVARTPPMACYKNNMFLFCSISARRFNELGYTHITGYNKLWRNSHGIIPMAFQPSENRSAYIWRPCGVQVADNDVVEFVWRDGALCAHRIRTDRAALLQAGSYYGNSFDTAEQIYNSFTVPMNITDIMQSDNYFATGKRAEYRALTKFNAWVKAQLLAVFRGAHTVVDLAAGKGQDLFTLHGLGISRLIFIDRDKTALLELEQRKHNLNNMRYYFFYKQPVQSEIKTLQVDLSANLPVLRAKFNECVDGAVMNFALHYFAATLTSLRKICTYIAGLLKPGAHVVFTLFDGARVYAALQRVAPGACILGDANARYSIRRDFTKTKSITGAQIAVKLPFSQGQYYPEYLVNFADVGAAFARHDCTVVRTGSFADMFAEYAKYERHVALDDADRAFAAMYSYIVIARN